MFRFEHVAFNVKDVHAVVKWYCDTLGLVIVRQQAVAPFMTFLADPDKNMMFEFYQQDTVVGDYASLPPFTFHVAFAVDDMDSTRQKWIAAGGSAAGEVNTTPTGDKLAFIRDPWGLTLQLVQRAIPML